jgi:hypothetical protein
MHKTNMAVIFACMVGLTISWSYAQAQTRNRYFYYPMLSQEDRACQDMANKYATAIAARKAGMGGEFGQVKYWNQIYTHCMSEEM